MTSNSKSNRLTRSDAACANNRIVAAMLLLVVLMLAGCQKQLRTGYGRAFGPEYSDSINGTYVFHELVEATGYEVDRYKKFSPRWDKYQTVFWIPDTYGCPSQELVNKIENWLASDWNRTVILVLRDFDARLNYWESLQQTSTDSERMEYYDRQQMDATTSYLYEKSTMSSSDCQWYRWVSHPYTIGSEFNGVLYDELLAAELDLRYSDLPAPILTNTEDSDEQVDPQFQTEILFSVDDQPFIFRLSREHWRQSQLLIVGNASFLLNLPMTNAANRELASELVLLATEEDFSEHVLFIEGGIELPISERDSPDIQSEWSWITQKPLRFIVPNILFCCLLFCFVYFPIFGRPKTIKKRSTANFRDHLDALGRLMTGSKSRELADSWIEEYKQRSTDHRPVD